MVIIKLLGIECLELDFFERGDEVCLGEMNEELFFLGSGSVEIFVMNLLRWRERFCEVGIG